MKIRITLSLLLLPISIMFAQGRVDGFYKGKGNIEVALSGGAEFASHFYAGTDRINLARNIYNTSLTISNGLHERLDLYLNIPYVLIGGVGSVQDGSVFLKYLVHKRKLVQGQLSFNLALGASTNLANYQTGGINAIGQQASLIDIRPVIHYQKGSWFLTAQYAYNYKFDPVPNATNGSLKVGKAMANYYFDFWYEHQFAFGGFDYLGTPSPPSFRELGVGFHKVGGTYYRPLGERFGLFFGAAFVLYGRNIGQGPIVNIGLVLKND